MTTNEKLRELLHEAHSELLYLKVEVGFRRNTLAVIERIEAALADPVAEPARDWQAECLKKGFEYVRESDDHYVIASPAEMVALLRDLLGIDVRQKNGRDYGVAVCELQEQIDGLVNTLHSKLTDRPAQAGQQEPVAHRLINAAGEVMTDWHDGPAPDHFIDLCGTAMAGIRVELAYSTPQPSPATAALVEALESTLAQCLAWQGEPHEYSCEIHASVVELARNALATYCAQQEVKS